MRRLGLNPARINFGAELPRLDTYIASTERMRRLAALRSAPRGPNPFVLGEPAVERALTVMDECTQAQRDRFKMMMAK